MVVAEALKAWRATTGLSQAELAKKIEIHRAQIGAWEAARHSPTYGAIERLARFFDTDVIGFLSGPARGSQTAPAEGHVLIPVYESRDLIGLHPPFPIPDELEPVQMIAVPRDFSHCAALATGRATDRFLAPEIRVGDICAILPSATAKDRQLVVAIARDPEQSAYHFVAGEYHKRERRIVPVNPATAGFSLEDYEIVGVIEALLHRDYRRGVLR